MRHVCSKATTCLAASPVKVFDAVYLVRGVDGERNAVETLAAHRAVKAVRMVGLACRAQNLQPRVGMYI